MIDVFLSVLVTGHFAEVCVDGREGVRGAFAAGKTDGKQEKANCQKYAHSYGHD
jgi:hypothetical protein